jgi:hypothetical protein
MIRHLGSLYMKDREREIRIKVKQNTSNWEVTNYLEEN